MAETELTAVPAEITSKDVTAFMALTVQIREADSLKRKLEKQREPIKVQLTAWLKENLQHGADVLTKFKHTFKWRSLGKKVDWESEWVKLYEKQHGKNTGPAAAAKLQAKTPTSYSLVVEPIV